MIRTILVLFASTLVSCQAAASSADVSPTRADSLIRVHAQSTSFVLVDVRTPEEFATGRIAAAQLIDFQASDFQDRIAKLPRDAEILIYCRSGRRSGAALQTMRDMGFKNASHIAGGINAWRAQGLPVAP